jgi:hypothetical protein
MPTKLLKDVKRETLAVIDTKGRLQIVTLKAGDMLEFRAKGKRFKYSVPLAACYNMALIYTAHEWQRARIERYNERRKNGERAKKPRPLARIFNPKLYEALATRITVQK